MQAAKDHGQPAVWLYRRTEKPKLEIDDPDFDTKRDQWLEVKDFFAALNNSDGPIIGVEEGRPVHGLQVEGVGRHGARIDVPHEDLYPLVVVFCGSADRRRRRGRSEDSGCCRKTFFIW